MTTGPDSVRPGTGQRTGPASVDRHGFADETLAERLGEAQRNRARQGRNGSGGPVPTGTATPKWSDLETIS